ncbi:MAG: hypothetical protein HOE90_09015 [Bacteriovoracaceae bacterium]|jgi:hypothetical protein|nr:hypothetical protein [Bacteriovoracaceae bacterium]
MKNYALLLVVMSMMAVGCSSTSHKAEGSRYIASTDSGCKLEKREGRDHYRVALDGQPFNQYWYTYSDAAGLLQRLEDKGRCE